MGRSKKGDIVVVPFHGSLVVQTPYRGSPEENAEGTVSLQANSVGHQSSQRIVGQEPPRA